MDKAIHAAKFLASWLVSDDDVFVGDRSDERIDMLLSYVSDCPNVLFHDETCLVQHARQLEYASQNPPSEVDFAKHIQPKLKSKSSHRVDRCDLPYLFVAYAAGGEGWEEVFHQRSVAAIAAFGHAIRSTGAVPTCVV